METNKKTFLDRESPTLMILRSKFITMVPFRISKNTNWRKLINSNDP